MAHIRGFILLVVIVLVIGGLMNLWEWINPPPKRAPSPPPPPPVADSFEADVYSISKVTRGSSFQHYEIKFSRATNGQDDLKYYKANSEDELTPFIGQHVKVSCNRSEGMQKCYWLTRMESGSNVITQK